MPPLWERIALVLGVLLVAWQFSNVIGWAWAYHRDWSWRVLLGRKTYMQWLEERERHASDVRD